MNSTNRRNFLKIGAMVALHPLLTRTALGASGNDKPVLRPDALRLGDVIGLITPASPLFEGNRTLLEAKLNLESIGFDVKFPFKEVLFSANMRYVGKQETVESDKIRQLGSYNTTNLELKIPVTEHGEITIYAENLFDKEYQERFGYPMPGRIIGASAKIGF